MWRDGMNPEELRRRAGETAACGTPLAGEAAGREGVERRAFLKAAASVAAGLVVACFLPQAMRRALAEGAPAAPVAKPPVSPNAFIRITADDRVTILLKHSEMGQGVWTSLPMVVAEELGCDWSAIGVEHAPAAQEYAHTAYGTQMTGGSTSTWESFDQLRTAGAMARELLIAAAAAKLGVKASDCRVERGVIVHGAHRVRFGEVTEAAAKLPMPADVKLKAPKDWTIIGKPTRRLDSLAKTTGAAEFGIDVKRPDMAVAVIARAPMFGAKLKKFDATKAKAIAGVIDVVEVPNGVAVLGNHFWAAKQGRDALALEWDEGAFAKASTPALRDEYRKLAATPGAPAKVAGDAEAVLKAANTVIEAQYETPFLAHAPMEPLNCTVTLGADGCEIWTGTQFQGVDQLNVAKALGIEPGKVRIHTTFLGGGFGRRANPQSDFIVEAALVAKAAKRTVKVVWTREDDIRGGWYRPMWLSRLRASLAADGRPAAWTHTLVGQSIAAGTPFEPMMVKDGVDATSVEGAADSPYLAAIAAHRVDLHSPSSPLPVLWWRSVGHSNTAFVVESFLDECAHAAKQDPLAYRRAMLPKDARERRALDLAAEKFGWGKPLPPGRGAGLAVHASFGSYVAHVAEVSVEKGAIRVHRVVCAIDCGPVVNPLTVEAQMQSAIAYGLSAALHGELTLKDGRIEQSNFHDYPALRLPEMPVVEVHIVPSTDAMGGCGEPGLPPIAPAVGNAVFALTGKRLRKLPFRLA
ncbi:molybdopterin cofactor-binding domain-containing protein [Dokdonella sp.]|uniref:xanthine dehydrogenase family protein molybdopterin-binding subunit n=1 Tax=Dokdonella sp. TaxID=2291710 RepID=UPI003784F765